MHMTKKRQQEKQKLHPHDQNCFTTALIAIAGMNPEQIKLANRFIDFMQGQKGTLTWVAIALTIALKFIKASFEIP